MRALCRATFPNVVWPRATIPSTHDHLLARVDLRRVRLLVLVHRVHRLGALVDCREIKDQFRERSKIKVGVA